MSNIKIDINNRLTEEIYLLEMDLTHFYSTDIEYSEKIKKIKTILEKLAIKKLAKKSLDEYFIEINKDTKDGDI
jgi:hypothetical protein